MLAVMDLGDLANGPITKHAAFYPNGDEVIDFTFRAHAGDLISIAATPGQSNGDLRLAVYDASNPDPTKQPLLAYNDDQHSFCDPSSDTYDPAIDLVAAGDATFRVSVEDYYPAGAGGTPFTLDIHRQSAAFMLAEDGDDSTSHPVTLSAAGVLQIYQAESSANAAGAVVTLAAEDGAVLATGVMGDDAAGPFISQFVTAGTYSISLSGDGQHGARLRVAVEQAEEPGGILSVPYGPNAMVSEDFNGDGFRDIVTFNNDSRYLSILLGHRDGTFSFGAPIDLPITFLEGTLATADCDGDTIPDLVVATQPYDYSTSEVVSETAPATLSIMRGVGDGTFTKPKQIVSLTGRVDGMAVGNLDDNGRPAIVLVNSETGTVSVRRVESDGTFGPSRDYHLAAGLQGVGIGDVNGDQCADFVVSNSQTGDVTVFRGHAGGGFDQSEPRKFGITPSSIAVADITGDDRDDVIAADLGAGTVSLLAGHADGSLELRQTVDVGRRPRAVTVTDFNGDGRKDVASISDTDCAASVLLGQADGLFGGRIVVSTSVSQHGYSPTAILAGNFNDDHLLDLAVLNTGDETVSVVLGNGDGTFRDDQTLSIGGGGANQISVGDFNGDGRADVAGAIAASNQISIQLGRGDGTFVRQTPVSLRRRPLALCVSDVNGDHRDDIVAATRDETTGDGQLEVLFGLGDGRFSAGPVLPVGRDPFAVAVGDIDHDGFPDIVSANYSSDTVTVERGLGGGLFVRQPDYRLGNGTHPMALSVCDVTGDSLADVIVAENGASRVVVLAGGPGCTVAEVSSVAVGPSPRALVVADLDGDRRIDIATASRADGSVSIAVGRADGSFAGATTLAVDSNLLSIAAADLNGDRLPDIVAVDNSQDKAHVLLGIGAGQFQQATADLDVGHNPTSVAVADVNSDGRPDILFASYNVDFLTVFNVRQAGPLTVGRDDRAPYNYSLAAADIDGDGKQDVVQADYETGTISLLVGQSNGLLLEKPHSSTAVVGLGKQLVLIGRVDTGMPGAALFATKSYDDYSVSLFQMHSDGAIDVRRTIPLPMGTFCKLIRDLDHDGSLDLIVRDKKPGIVFLKGRSDGTFAEPRRIAVDSFAGSVVADDFDGNGVTDLAVSCDHSVCFVFGKDDYSFNDSSTLSIPIEGATPPDVVKADATGDGIVDLVVTNDAHQVFILKGDGHGGFVKHAVSDFSGSMTVKNLDKDEVPDILVATHSDGTKVILLADDGNRVVADITGDSRFDFVASREGSMAVMLGDGGGLFHDRHVVFPVNDITVIDASSRLYPVIGPSLAVSAASDDTAGGIDLLSMDRTNSLKVRPARVTAGSGVLASSGNAVCDACFVSQPTGPRAVAAIDTRRDAVSIFDVTADGQAIVVQRIPAPVPEDGETVIPVLSRIISADLNGDGYGDLIVSNAGSGMIDILVAGEDGEFDAAGWQQLSAGAGTTRILLVDVNGDDVPDLLAANEISGDVSVRFGVAEVLGTDPFEAESGFGPESRYLASAGVRAIGVDPYSGQTTAVAAVRLTDIAVGDVTGDGRMDIVATCSQSHTFAILAGLPGGGFSAPQEHLASVTVPGGQSLIGPTLALQSTSISSVAVGYFDGDPRADIVLLDRDNERLLLYESSRNPSLDAAATVIPLTGNLPRSLLVADSTGPKGVPDGVLDILVGNDYGDVLVLQGRAAADGKGTGEFETVVRTDKSVALMAADIDGDGKDDFVYGNKGLDRVTMSRTATKQSFEADQKQGVIGPSAVATVVETVGGRQMKNLVVANGGANQIMLFSRNMDAATSASDIFLPPQRFFVGTNPSAVSVADVDQDGIPDVVVANGGSNDISVMLGTMAGGRWTMKAGPRLVAGGTNPAGVAIGDFVTGSGSPGKDGIPDIAVTNRGSNSANIIAGRGQGFFNDQVPVPLVLPPNAQPGPIFANAGRIGIGNIGANSVTLFDTTRRGAGTESFASRTYSSGGGSPSSLATYTSGGTTYLAVGNLSGSVSLFLGRAGPLEFSLQNSFTLPNVTGLAFDSTGRLFGMSPARESALQLFAFEGQASGPTVANASLAALGAAVFYLPLRASAVALVATIVSSGAVSTGTAAAGEGDAKAVPLNAEEKGEGDAAAGGSAEGDGAGQKRDAAQPGEDGTESKTGEDPAAAGLKLFLDIDKTLKANNGRLLETLLDDRPEEAGEPDREAAEPAAAAGEAAKSVPRPDGRLAVWRQWAEVKGHRDTEAGPRGAGWPGSTVELVAPVAFVFPATIADAACVRMPPWTSGRSDEPAQSRTRQRRRRSVDGRLGPRAGETP